MSAQLLPNGRQQFVDQNGNPLVSGLVYFYVTNTTTPKNTWQDAGETILNPNPIILDARGQATIFGSGDYRQVLTDAAGNTIWDKNLSSPVVPASETEAGILELASNADVEAGTDTTKAVTPAGVWDWYTNAKVFTRTGASATPRTLSDVLTENISVNIQDFGGSPSNPDNSAALNAAADYCVATGARRIYFPGFAEYYFTQAPNSFTVGIVLESDAPRGWLIRNYIPTDDATPFLQWVGGTLASADGKSGGGLRNIGVYANDGTAKGSAITVTAPSTANAAQSPGYLSFDNVVISGGGTWGIAVMLDGSANQTSGGQGIRDISFKNISIFKPTNTGLLITNGVHILGGQLAIFPEVGATGINVTGSGTSLTNSNDISLTGLDVSNDVLVQNAVDVVLEGIVRGNVSIQTSAQRCSFGGVLTGTYSNPSNASVYSPASGTKVFPDGMRLMWKQYTDNGGTLQQTIALPQALGIVLSYGVTIRNPFVGTYSLNADSGNWYLTFSASHTAVATVLWAIGY